MRVRLRHPILLASRIMVLNWIWHNRHDLVRWGRFVWRLPTEVRTRDLDDLVTEARARIVLSADSRTRFAGDLDITGFDNGALIVQAPGEKPIAQVARDLLGGVSGVVEVRLVDDRLPADDPTRTDSTRPLTQAVGSGS